jgi:serine/threonine protein kinase
MKIRSVSFEIIVEYLVYGILKALEYLHHKKIIHRDLKPENIIIDEHGLPHLTDFGIAEVYK